VILCSATIADLCGKIIITVSFRYINKPVQISSVNQLANLLTDKNTVRYITNKGVYFKTAKTKADGSNDDEMVPVILLQRCHTALTQT